MSNCILLIIGDRQDAEEFLAILAGTPECDVYFADNPQQAEAISRAIRPDAICLDIEMPDVDGYALAKSLRQIPGLQKCRIVAVGGDPPGRERLTSAGVDMHLLKPVAPSVLVDVLCEEAG